MVWIKLKRVCDEVDTVPVLDAGATKDRPYQSDIYAASFYAILSQAREQGSLDID